MYDIFKNKLIAEFEEKREHIVAHAIHTSPESLFGIRTQDDKIYARILIEFERIALQNVEDLTISLLQKYEIESGRNISKCSWWDIEINDSDKKAKIVFSSNPSVFNSERIHSYAQEIESSADDTIYIVFLLKDSIETRKAVNNFQVRFNKFSSKVTALIFEDFIEIIFGSLEKVKFQTAMLNFKGQFHQAIGYQVTELCSPYNLERLKETLATELVQFPYEIVRDKHYSERIQIDSGTKFIYNRNFEAIKSEYINNSKFKMLLSGADFSSSFLSSEWLYRKYVSLDTLDNTFIVTGYLKSIEQLLWDIIVIFGRENNLRNLEFQPSGNNKINEALGSLEWFVSRWENGDLYIDILGDSKKFVQAYLKEQISLWRTQARNGYFHKHKLEERTQIDAIREDTLFLYFLILGSIKLSHEDIKKITS